MSYEECYAKASLFDKLADGMLDPEMIKDTIKIAKDSIKDKVHFNLIIDSSAGGNAPLVSQEIADRLHSEK